MVGAAGFMALWLVAASPPKASAIDTVPAEGAIQLMAFNDGVPVPIKSRGTQKPPSSQVDRSLVGLNSEPSDEPREEGIPGLRDAFEQPAATPDRDGIPGLEEAVGKGAAPAAANTAPPPHGIPEPRRKPRPSSEEIESASEEAGQAVCSDEADAIPSSGQGRLDNGRTALRRWLDGISADGWIEQGLTINTLSPHNRQNGPVTFNNGSNEYQLNQLYMQLKRKVDRESDFFSLGGQVDLLYGTDSAYVTARGLEVFDDLSPKWNAQQYGLAMPQCYAEVFAPWGNGLSVKLGHFYSILGYESVMAPDNFFYSHSYLRQYAEPFTYTGLLGESTLGNFTIQAGMTRGDNNWEDNNNDLGFVGGISWTSANRRTNIGLCVDAGREQPDPSTNVCTIYSLVIQQKLGARWQYVFQWDIGNEPGAGDGMLSQTNANWYGVDNYLFCTINERWKAGLRFEWFRDEGGARVPDAGRTADYFELTAGANWTPNRHVAVRPEIRWDWTGTPDYYPFGDGARSHQLLLACDLLVRF